jgi:hypothetical protein
MEPQMNAWILVVMQATVPKDPQPKLPVMLMQDYLYL